ncbi:MAG: BrxA/BrxB family bacilliredoxin [bacterium]|nr:BrxA/BrxB family bacilliredoxin [bacterium]
MQPPVYKAEAVRPMWEELAQVGIKPLTTADEVDEYVTKKTGTTLVVINSVCGCAAGNARPGAMLALQHKTIPDHLTTVFAGMDHEAVDRARSYMPVPPSSPCIGLFKEGQMIHSLERRQIEQMDAEEIAENLTAAFDNYCTAQGPSCPPETFQKIIPVDMCGSDVPPHVE